MVKYWRALAVGLILGLTLPGTAAAEPTIATIAGTGTAGFSGDGGPAVAAQLDYPYGIALDSSGNLYIADMDNNRIRKVDAGGIISTVAGTGTGGFSGDGGVATAAMLQKPSGIAADSSGNLYIADYKNNRIRKVDTVGIISTVAGTGTGGYSGDGDLATAAQLQYPYAVALDSSGSLYIADMGNNRIRRVDATGIISTVAGTGTAGYSGDGGVATAAKLKYPVAVALDSSGSLYIADAGNNRIRKVDAGGSISTVAGAGMAGFSGDGGLATAAQLQYPNAVAADDSGNFYISDFSSNRVRKVDAAGYISTVAGTGTAGYSGDGGLATEAMLDAPRGIAAGGSGDLYIADKNNNVVREVSAAGVPTTTSIRPATTTIGPGGCLDHDGDSFGVNCGSGPDCNDDNAGIHPGAEELCGDSVDNNCNTFIDENCGETTSTTTTTSGDSNVTCPAEKILGEHNPDLEDLRNFRDSSLAQSALGRKLVKIYYSNAASITVALDRSPALRALARGFLKAVIAQVK